MRKGTYRIGDGTFAFSPAVFDSLLGHGAKGAARMRARGRDARLDLID